MKIKWWPWGILTAISLALLLFFVLYPLAVLFSSVAAVILFILLIAFSLW